MSKREPFILVYDPGTAHLEFLEEKWYSLIEQTIKQQLLYEPLNQTRNRKPLRKPIGSATWEVRCGPKNRFRILYYVDEEAHEVHILAIGVKEKNRLIIGGKEVEP